MQGTVSDIRYPVPVNSLRSVIQHDDAADQKAVLASDPKFGVSAKSRHREQISEKTTGIEAVCAFSPTAQGLPVDFEVFVDFLNRAGNRGAQPLFLRGFEVAPICIAKPLP